MGEKIKTIYSFIGLPASGKGTQVNILSRQTKAKVVGIGSLIRDSIAKGGDDAATTEIKKRYDHGDPQPDRIVTDLIKDYLEDAEHDVIFDNFPFSLPQAEFLHDYLVRNADWQFNLIWLKLDPEVAIKRAMTRKICTECGAIFIATSETRCKKCGGELMTRADDNEETVRTRIHHYLPKISQVVNYFSNDGGRVIIVDGMKSIEEVAQEIESKL